MTNAAVSRSPSTLADLLHLVATHPTPSKRQKQDMCSAIRTAARLLGKPLDALPATPGLLRPPLNRVAPQAHGLSKARWVNILSLLRKALSLARPMIPARNSQSMAPEWLRLYKQVESRSIRLRVSRLIRCLSVRGLGPNSVTREALEGIAAELIETSLSANPEQTWRETAAVWNKLSGTIAGWCQIRIPIAVRRKTYAMKWSVFPDLRRDVDRYAAIRSGQDLLLDHASLRPARESTIEIRVRQFLVFASALVHRGYKPGSLRSIGDIVTLDAFKEGLRFFMDRNGGKSSTTIQGLAGFLVSVARHYVKADTEALQAMSAITRRLAIRQQGLTAKNRTRLRALGDPKTASALLHLPQTLLAEAKTEKSKYKAALSAQSAVAVEILLMAPLRLGNLRRLDLDQHVQRLGLGRKSLHLALEGEDMKNGDPAEFPLPAESVALIDEYIATYRPTLAAPGNSKLFPGRQLSAKSASGLRRQIQLAVFRHTEMKVHPHLFRHVGAFFYLAQHPGGYGVINKVLTHRRMATTMTFYCGQEGAAAVRHFDNTILALRHQGRDVHPMRDAPPPRISE